MPGCVSSFFSCISDYFCGGDASTQLLAQQQEQSRMQSILDWLQKDAVWIKGRYSDNQRQYNKTTFRYEKSVGASMIFWLWRLAPVGMLTGSVYFCEKYFSTAEDNCQQVIDLVKESKQLPSALENITCYLRMWKPYQPTGKADMFFDLNAFAEKLRIVWPFLHALDCKVVHDQLYDAIGELSENRSNFFVTGAIVLAAAIFLLYKHGCQENAEHEANENDTAIGVLTSDDLNFLCEQDILVTPQTTVSDVKISLANKLNGYSSINDIGAV